MYLMWFVYFYSSERIRSSWLLWDYQASNGPQYNQTQAKGKNKLPLSNWEFRCFFLFVCFSEAFFQKPWAFEKNMTIEIGPWIDKGAGRILINIIVKWHGFVKKKKGEHTERMPSIYPWKPRLWKWNWFEKGSDHDFENILKDHEDWLFELVWSQMNMSKILITEIIL